MTKRKQNKQKCEVERGRRDCIRLLLPDQGKATAKGIRSLRLGGAKRPLKRSESQMDWCL